MLCRWTGVIFEDGHLLPLNYVSTALNLLRSPSRSVKKVLAIKNRMMNKTVLLCRHVRSAQRFRYTNVRTYSLIR